MSDAKTPTTNAISRLQMAGYGVSAHPNMAAPKTLIIRRRDQSIATTLPVAADGVCAESVDYLVSEVQHDHRRHG